MGSSALRICSCMKYASPFPHRGQSAAQRVAGKRGENWLGNRAAAGGRVSGPSRASRLVDVRPSSLAAEDVVHLLLLRRHRRGDLCSGA